MEFNLFWVESVTRGKYTPLLVLLPFFFFLFNIFIQVFRERLIVGKSACDNPERYGVVLSSLFFKEI